MKVKVKEKSRKTDVFASLRKTQDMKLTWGFFEDSEPYPVDGNRYKDETPVAQVAMWVEEGHDNGGIFEGTTTPPRPFMSTQADQAKPKLRVMTKKYYKQLLKGNITAKERLETIGEAMVDDLQEEIMAWSNPPNLQGTVDKKGFNDPLIETGRMYDSVDYKIEIIKPSESRK